MTTAVTEITEITETTGTVESINPAVQRTLRDISEEMLCDVSGDVTLFLPASARVRRDSTQIIIYSSLAFDIWVLRLRPEHAIVLSLFDGTRRVRDVIRETASLGKLSLPDAEKLVRWLLYFIEYENGPKLMERPVPAVRKISNIATEQCLMPSRDFRISLRLDWPVSLMLMATNVCQTDCVYCYACRREVPPEELLPLERIIAVLDEAEEMGVCHVNLDGGDFLCRKECVEIMQALTDRKMATYLSTKAYISEEKAKALADAGLIRVQLGLDASEPELIDYAVGIKGFMRRVLETIDHLNKAGVIVRTNSIITKRTLHNLPELVDFLMTLPLSDIKVAPAFRSLYRGEEDLLLDAGEKQWFREQMRRAEEKYPDRAINWECTDDVLDISPEARQARFENRPLCSSGRTQCIITPDGKVTTCEQGPQEGEFIVGDLRTQSLREVWQSPEMRAVARMPRERFKGTVCYTCPDFVSCVWEMGHCFLQTYKAYGRVYGPNPLCPKADLPEKRSE